MEQKDSFGSLEKSAIFPEEKGLQQSLRVLHQNFGVEIVGYDYLLD